MTTRLEVQAHARVIARILKGVGFTAPEVIHHAHTAMRKGNGKDAALLMLAAIYIKKDLV